jgi:hypothetical protein
MSDAAVLELMARKIAELSRRLAALERQDRPAGGGGATTLSGLSDVTVAAPADNELLAWDATAGEWQNQTAAEAGLAAEIHHHDASYAALVHAARHAASGADPVSPDDIGAAAEIHDHDTLYAYLHHAWQHEDDGPDPTLVDAAAGTGSRRTLGTGAQQAAAGNHNHNAAYAALVHKARHATGGADALSAADIGAEPAASGTAFPASPAAGQHFFRSDLQWLCVYDGTRWLTSNEFSATYTNTAVTASNTAAFHLLPPGYTPLFTRLRVTTYVATTNNASNYWEIHLRSTNLASSDATLVGTATNTGTTPDTANTYYDRTQTPGYIALGSNTHHLDVRFIKTNTPGTLVAYLTVFYRLIVA